MVKFNVPGKNFVTADTTPTLESFSRNYLHEEIMDALAKYLAKEACTEAK